MQPASAEREKNLAKEQPLIVMLSDLSNKAQTKAKQSTLDASTEREHTSQETEPAGLRIDKILWSDLFETWIRQPFLEYVTVISLCYLTLSTDK